MNPYYHDERSGISLYHGDAKEIVPALDCGAILSDPPYGNSYNPNGGIPRSIAYRPIAGNDGPFDPSWILSLSKPTILWGANHYASRLPDMRGWLVWWKHAYIVAGIELAWTNCVSRPDIFDYEWRGGARSGESSEPHLHPTQKPLKLMEWCMKKLPADAVVCDPYAGSGTTLRAAKDCGRMAVGVEIDEAYCEVIARRLSQEVFLF